MYIDAIFAVEEEAINALVSKQVNQRMNYILGSGIDQSFESYLLDMNEFSEEKELYDYLIQTFALDLHELTIKNMLTLYQDATYSIYYILSSQINELYQKLTTIEEYLPYDITKINHISSFKNLLDKFFTFYDLVKKANDCSGSIVFVMHSEKGDAYGAA